MSVRREDRVRDRVSARWESADSAKLRIGSLAKVAAATKAPEARGVDRVAETRV